MKHIHDSLFCLITFFSLMNLRTEFFNKIVKEELNLILIKLELNFYQNSNFFISALMG